MAQTAVNKAFPRKLPIFRCVWGATFGFVGVSGGVRYGYVSGTFGAATKLLQTDDTNDQCNARDIFFWNLKWWVVLIVRYHL